jgi:putative MATE family efflux protein
MKEVRKEIPGMFDGPILKLLVSLAMPIFTGMIFQLVYTITDTIWISRIDLNDPSYVGGTGMIFPIIFFAIAIGNGILIGTSSLVARAIGRQDYQLLGKTAESGLAIAFSFSILILIMGFVFGDKLVGLLGASNDYAAHALEYLYFITPAAVIMLLGNVFFGILQGEGLMKKVMQAMIIGTVSNIILDPIFIFVLNLEVRGAAIATGIAQTLSLLFIISVFLRKKTLVQIEWKIRNITLPTIREIAVIGFPQTISMATMSMSFLIFNRVVVNIDQLALTAFALVGRFDQVVLIPTFAMGAALLTMMGQNWGRGNYDRVKKIWYTGIISTAAVVFSLAAVMVAIAPTIYPLFSKISNVVRYAVLQTRIMEFTFVFAVVGILGRSTFQGTGNPIPALIITLLRLLVIAVPAVLLYVYVFHMGIYGVYLGLITGNVLSAVITLIWVPTSINRRIHRSVLKLEVEKISKMEEDSSRKDAGPVNQ